MERFLDRGYPRLDEAGRRAFERLLGLPDQDILEWLYGTSTPDDDQLRALVSAMRDVVSSP